MKILGSLTAGLAGAVALTALHETVRLLRPADAPRMDVLGMRGLRKLIGKAEAPQPNDDALFDLTIAGDVLSNGLYYSLVGSGRHALRRGLVLGAAAGIGGVLLPVPLGLGEAPTNRTPNPAHDRGLVHGRRAGGRCCGPGPAETIGVEAAFA